MTAGMNPRAAALVPAAVLAIALLTACQTVPAQAPAPQASQFAGLSDTAWRFTRFTAPDAARGVTEPEGRVYTLSFHADGTVTGRFDCNRVASTWNEGAFGPRGTPLYLTPAAMTRMACPAGSLDTMLAAMLPDVASYTMAGGKLHITLKTGGVLSFTPDR